jgi:anti-sigma regulatory factor (Ser/Thr protein kinase)
MEHAYRSLKPPPPVILNIQASEEALTLDIIDRGKPFDFDSYIPPRFPDHWDAGHTRGVGLYLILHCMDDMSYEQLADNSNRLRLVKRLNDACGASN